MAGNQRHPEVIVDDKAFQAGLRRAIAGIKLETEADLTRFAQRVVRSARQFCPVQYGVLRGSINATPGRDSRGLFYDIGTNVEYALPVEFGTRYQQAQPFMRRGLADAVQGGLR